MPGIKTRNAILAPIEKGSFIVSRRVRHPPMRTSMDYAHDVAFLHDQEFLTVDLDLGARPLAEQHLVALLDIEGRKLTGLVAGARADGDDLALLGLLGCGVGDDDAARRSSFRYRRDEPPRDHARDETSWRLAS